MAKILRSVFESKATVKAETRGMIISPKSFNFALLIFISLEICKRQVKRFEKYIIIIKPLSPIKGKRAITNTILNEESERAVKKV